MSIKFSKNWGGKLNLDYFTTVRQDKGYWQTQIGKQHEVLLSGKFFGFAGLVFVIPINVSQITSSFALFDADMLEKDLVVMLEKMYGKNPSLQLLFWEKTISKEVMKK